MKRMLLVLALTVPLVALTGCPEEEPRDERVEVREIDRGEMDEARGRIVETMQRGAPQEVAELFVENAYYSPSGGVVHTSRDEIRRAEEEAPRTTEYRMQQRDGGGEGHSAWEAGTWTRSFEGPGEEDVSISGNYLLVLERARDQRHTAAADHQDTVMAAEPETGAADHVGWRIRALVVSVRPEDAEQMRELRGMEPAAPTAERQPGVREDPAVDRPVPEQPAEDPDEVADDGDDPVPLDRDR